VNTNPEVETWFAELQHPLAPVMRGVREVILSADARMTEQVQYGTVQFADPADVQACADELVAITAAWIAYKGA
jgi:hypothetical protein